MFPRKTCKLPYVTRNATSILLSIRIGIDLTQGGPRGPLAPPWAHLMFSASQRSSKGVPQTYQCDVGKIMGHKGA